MVATFVFSPPFGIPQSIRARTVRSCFEVVANAMSKVFAGLSLAGVYAQLDLGLTLIRAYCRVSDEVVRGYNTLQLRM